MPSNIVVSCYTRNREHMAFMAIDLMYQACSDPNNFEVHLIIDRGQEYLYEPLLWRYPNIKVGIVDHTENSMNSCQLKSIQMFRESGGYFLLILTDDNFQVINGWDRRLIAKKGSFEDDLFSIHSHSNFGLRTPRMHDSVYTIDPNDPEMIYSLRLVGPLLRGIDMTASEWEDYALVYCRCELAPIFTYKFAEFVEQVYLRDSNTLGPDLVTGLLLQQLYRLTGLKRTVYGWPFHFNSINDGVTHELASSRPLSMQVIKDVANEMVQYLSQSSSSPVVPAEGSEDAQFGRVSS